MAATQRTTRTRSNSAAAFMKQLDAAELWSELKALKDLDPQLCAVQELRRLLSTAPRDWLRSCSLRWTRSWAACC